MAKKNPVPSGIDSRVVLEAEYLLEGVGERLAKTKLSTDGTERPNPPPVTVGRVRSDNPTVLFGAADAVKHKQATVTSGQQQHMQDMAKKTTGPLKEDQSTHDTSTDQTSQVPFPKNNNKKGDDRKKKKKQQQQGCCCYCC